MIVSYFVMVSRVQDHVTVALFLFEKGKNTQGNHICSFLAVKNLYKGKVYNCKELWVSVSDVVSQSPPPK